MLEPGLEGISEERSAGSLVPLVEQLLAELPVEP